MHWLQWFIDFMNMFLQVFTAIIMLSNLLYARVEEESPVRIARLTDAEGFVDVQRGDAGLVADAEECAGVVHAGIKCFGNELSVRVGGCM